MFAQLCFWMEGLVIGAFSVSCFLKGRYILLGLVLGFTATIFALLWKKVAIVKYFWLDGFGWGVGAAFCFGYGYFLFGSLVYIFGSLITFWVASRTRVLVNY